MADSKIKCEARGGTWDLIAKTCSIIEPTTQELIPTDKPFTQEFGQTPSTLPSPTPIPPPKEEPKGLLSDYKPFNKQIKKEQQITEEQVFKEGEVVTDEETGEPKGIIKNGKYFPMGREDIEAVSQKQQAISAPIAGATITSERIQQEQQAQQAKQLASQFGLSDSEIANIQGMVTGQAPVNWSQAVTAGTAGNLGRIATYGVAALVGSGGNPIVGALGVAAAVWQGVQSNIKVQQTGEIGASKDVLTNAKTNMMKLSRLATTDPTHAEQYQKAYDFWLGEVYRARTQIKLETQGDLNAFMEDGRDILSDFDLFLLPDVGTAAIYKQRIIAALDQDLSPELLLAQLLEEPEV